MTNKVKKVIAVATITTVLLGGAVVVNAGVTGGGGAGASTNVSRGNTLSGSSFRSTLTVLRTATHGVNGMAVRTNNVNTTARSAWNRVSRTNNYPGAHQIQSAAVTLNSGQTGRGNYEYRRQGNSTWRALPSMDFRR